MVCLPQNWKISSIAEILTVESSRSATAEETYNDKIALQTMYDEIWNADEANLLQEEDMHIFGCKPMADPLQLVCCNVCKKPIQVSHYTAHAERCSSPNTQREPFAGLNGVIVHKNIPRKGKKIAQPTCADQKLQLSAEEKGRCKEINAEGASRLKSESQSLQCISHNMQVKGKVAPADPTAVCASSYSCGGAPQPLATKTYHLWSRHRLGFELGELYKMSCMANSSNPRTQDTTQVNQLLVPKASASNIMHYGQDDNAMHMKKSGLAEEPCLQNNLQHSGPSYRETPSPNAPPKGTTRNRHRMEAIQHSGSSG